MCVCVCVGTVTWDLQTGGVSLGPTVETNRVRLTDLVRYNQWFWSVNQVSTGVGFMVGSGCVCPYVGSWVFRLFTARWRGLILYLPYVDKMSRPVCGYRLRFSPPYVTQVIILPFTPNIFFRPLCTYSLQNSHTCSQVGPTYGDVDIMSNYILTKSYRKTLMVCYCGLRYYIVSE